MNPEQPHPDREELFAYRDGELKADRRVIIEAHVAACHACRETIDEVSRLESDLRGRSQEPGESYFSRMTESVMGRIAAVAPPVQDRRRSDAEAEWEQKRTRAPRLPWVAVFSTVGAAATVVVVGVLLFRQGALQRSIPPVAVLEKSAPDAGRQRSAAERDAAGKKRADTGRSKDASTRENAAAGSREELKKDEQVEQKAAEQEKQKPTLGVVGDQKPQPGSEAPAGTIAKKTTSEDLRSLPADEVAASPNAADAPRAAGVAAEGAGQYQAVLQRYGLPPTWGPGISDDLVTRAEPALRNLYRTGGVTTPADSARARLYFAEAARLKAGSFPDAVAIDEIVHHYQRAVGLAGGDSETGRIASARLQEFLKEQSDAPEN